MSEFERLIEAARVGAVDDVRLILQKNPELTHRKDDGGATALHHAAFAGHREVARLLVELGADINAADSKYGATPAGWAIEYLREMDGFLAIELQDFAFAIERGDVEWTKRFLGRFPHLRRLSDANGAPFKQLAAQCGNPEIARLFEP